MQLAARADATRPLLVFYGQLLGLQKDCYETLQRGERRLSGSLGRDLAIVRRCAPPLLNAVAIGGPKPLADEARRLLDGGEPAVDSMLLERWRTPSDRQFFAKALLQPYAQSLAERRTPPIDRDMSPGERACPFCGGAPQVSILQSANDADGGGRQLLCATCFTAWPLRRVCCAHCGAEDERELGYFHSPAFDHLRVDTCEICKRYIKTVDLTRLGLAVPVVDEVAGAPLDVWARERGYEKMELNLIGL